MTTIYANKLTTFSVASDGSSVSLGVADDSGSPSALVLPTECLRSLVLTLPEMASQTLRRQHRDPNLRLVFPVESWTVETSTEAGRLILTFATQDGYRASFALFANEIAEIARTTLCGEDAAEDNVPSSPPYLSH